MATDHLKRLAILSQVSAGLDVAHEAMAPLLIRSGPELVQADLRADGWASAAQFGQLRWRVAESADPVSYYVLDVRGLRGARGADISTSEACTMHVVAGTLLVWRPAREARYVPYGPAHPSSRCELGPGEHRSWIIAQDCQLFHVFHLLPTS